MDSGLSFIGIVGGLILAAVLLFATIRNRRAGGVGRAEQGAADLRASLNEEEHRRDRDAAG